MDTLRIPLAGSVGVPQVEQLHATIKTAVDSREPVALDFSEVRDIDTSILQLMLAAKAAAQSGDAQVEFTDFTDSFSQMLKSNGAEKLLATEGNAEEAPAEATDDSAPSDSEDASEAADVTAEATDHPPQAEADIEPEN